MNRAGRQWRQQWNTFWMVLALGLFLSAAVQAQGWSAVGSGIGPDITRIEDMTVDGDGNLYVCGLFTTIDGVVVNQIAKWDGSSWSPLGNGLPIGSGFVGPRLRKIVVDGSGNVYAGGRYNTDDGSVFAGGVAKWDGTSWSAIAGLRLPSAPNIQVFAMAIDANDNLYVSSAQDFRSIGGDAVTSIARWDGSSWSILETQTFPNNPGGARDLAVAPNGDVAAYVVDFGGPDDVVVWDGSSWTNVGEASSSIERVLVYDSNGTLYAGGNLATGISGTFGSVLQWDGGTSWSPVGTGLTEVLSLAADANGNLYAAGSLSFPDGSAGVAKWDGNAWSGLGAGIGRIVSVIAVDGDEGLYAGGDFEFAGPAAANGLAKFSFQGDRTPQAYVTNSGSGTVSVINTFANAVVATIPVGDSPRGIEMTPSGEFVYVANFNSADVSVINAASNSVSTTIPVLSGADDVAVSPDGSLVYVSTVANGVGVINTATNTLTTTIPVGGSAGGIVFSADGAFAYVTVSTGNVAVINTADNTLLTTIAVGANPVDLDISSDGASVVVVNQDDNSVSVISTATNTVTSTITGLDTPVGIEFTDPRIGYVSNAGSDNYGQIDLREERIRTSTFGPIGNEPYAISVRGFLLYSVNRLGNDVSVFIGQRPRATIAVGNAPWDFTIGVVAEPPTEPGDIFGVVTQDSLNGLAGVTVTLQDTFGIPLDSYAPLTTDAAGSYRFPSVPPGQYLVSVLEPVGLSADANPIPVEVINSNGVAANFNLATAELGNNSRSAAWWKRQFRLIYRGKAHKAQVTEQELLDYIDEVQIHYTPHFDYFQNATTIEDWFHLLRLGFRPSDQTRAKRQVAALVLNIVSLKVGQFTEVTADGRDAGDVLTYTSHLLAETDHQSLRMARKWARKVNRCRYIGPGNIPAGDLLYKNGSGAIEWGFASGLPESYSLGQNYPNPFNPSTTIRFDLPETATVRMAVYNLMGQKVRTLLSSEMAAGVHSLEWNGLNDQGTQVASGIYLYRLEAGSFKQTRKMILMK